MLLALAAGSLVLTKVKRAPITARRDDERVTPVEWTRAGQSS